MHGPLKWAGGKSYLAPKIVAMMPPHTHYVEPYFGGGAVLFAKDPAGVSEVANDIDLELTNFWTVLQNEVAFAEFARQVAAIPFSEPEFLDTLRPLTDGEYADGYGRFSTIQAVRFFVRCRQSYTGQMGRFAVLSRNRTRGGMNEQASAWLSAVDRLPEVHARLRRVVVLNRPALDVIRQQDGPNTFFYLDPPYLHETRRSTQLYRHEMAPSEHESLLKVLAGVEGKFLLSGYPSGLYEAWRSANGFEVREFDLPNNAAGTKAKRRMTECVWSNFTPEEAR